jgi:hypothetical protein
MNTDKLVARTRWYLRKVNRYSFARFELLRGRPVQVPPASRSQRLLAYKLALNARVEAERRR